MWLNPGNVPPRGDWCSHSEVLRLVLSVRLRLQAGDRISFGSLSERGKRLTSAHSGAATHIQIVDVLFVPAACTIRGAQFH